jgi:hypothetical protein
MRVEYKYRLFASDKIKVQHWLALQGFVPVFEPRWINSTYFDTSNLSCASDHIDGSSQRGKLRIRHYGDKTKVLNPKWEWKWRHGISGSKNIIPISQEKSNPQFQALITRYNIKTLHTRYFREYYQHLHNPIRITLDSSIRCDSLRPCQTNTTSTMFDLMEIKCPTQKLKILEKLKPPVRRLSFSKYIFGIKSLLLN